MKGYTVTESHNCIMDKGRIVRESTGNLHGLINRGAAASHAGTGSVLQVFRDEGIFRNEKLGMAMNGGGGREWCHEVRDEESEWRGKHRRVKVSKSVKQRRRRRRRKEGDR
ncbi:hypothetical protein ACLB2K_006459 [Fragaria x ananassa]